MGRGTLLVLCAAVVVAALLVFGPGGDAPPTPAGRFFPELGARVNDAARIEVTSADESFSVTRADGGWVLAERAGYPARFDAVKPLLLGLAELQIVESKTARPELHARIGVEDPLAEGASSTQVRVLDAQDAPLAELILGKAGDGDTLFVRRPGEAQSWSVRGSVPLQATPLAWMDKDLVRLSPERVVRIEFQAPDGAALVVSRPATDTAGWAIEGVPEGQEPKYPTIARTTAGAFDGLSFEDVRPRAEQPLPEGERFVTSAQTGEGLRVVATTALDELGQIWLVLQAEALTDANDEARREAEALQARHAAWTYRLPEWRAGTLRKRLADLVQDIAVEPEPATDDAPPAEEPAADDEATPAEAPAASDDALTPADAPAPADEPAPDGGR